MQVYQVYVTEANNTRSIQATYSYYNEADIHMTLLRQRMDEAGDLNPITVETLEVVDTCIIEHKFPQCKIVMCRVCEDIEHELREQDLAEMEGEL